MLAAVAMAGLPIGSARADGDPASDYLLANQVFLTSASGSLSSTQHQVLNLVRDANRAGFTIRVAIIATSYDLGSVAELFRQPRTYAQFLGQELTLGYKQRLLVVSPHGFGFNWPGHSSAPAYRLLAKIPIGAARDGLARAALAGVRRLAEAAHVAPSVLSTSSTAAAPARSGGGAPVALILIILTVVCVGSAAMIVVVRTRRRRPALGTRRRVATLRGPLPLRIHLAVTAAVLLGAGGVAAAIKLSAAAGRGGSSANHGPTSVQASSVVTPPPVTWPAGQRRAPDFSLRDQSGGPVSLAVYRGHEVIVTFIDPVCRNVCPLEAKVIDEAVQRVPAAQRPEVLAVSVNPYADARANLIKDARVWDLVPQWRWAVGSRSQLAVVWKSYRLAVAIARRKVGSKTITSVSHTAAAYILDASGHERALFIWPFYPQDVEHELRRLAS